MTNHPEELLAGYVDGTLTNEERAEVEAHLAACGTCREDVRLAGRSRTLLAELPEAPIPLGTTEPVLDEIRSGGRVRALRPRRARRATRGARPVWLGERAYRLAGVAAAAVVVFLLAVVALPNLGDDDPTQRSLREAAEDAAAPAAADEGFAELVGGPIYVEQDRDYDATAVEGLATAFAAARSLPANETAPEAVEDVADGEKAADAVECIARGTEAFPGTPAKLIDATYEGTPAHIGVFLEGPDGEPSPEAIIVWIVAREDCRILFYAEQRL